jgi:hypothetical protein
MGYDMEELLADLDSIPMSWRWFGSDALRIAYGLAYPMLELAVLKHKLQLLPKWGNIHAHR